MPRHGSRGTEAGGQIVVLQPPRVEPVLQRRHRTAVAEGTALIDTVTESSYTPASLELGTTYYWRVNEVNEAEQGMEKVINQAW